MTHIPLYDELVSIERSLWRNDATIYAGRLEDDAVLVFAETGPIGKDEAVRAIQQENAEGRHWAEVELYDETISRPRPDVSLLRYRARARWANDDREHHTLASSLYVRNGEHWRLAFHQQTPLPPIGEHPLQPSSSRESSVRRQSVGAAAAGATAVGAFAVGALAIGALAIGKLAIGALTLKRARIRSLTVDDVLVGRLRVMEAQL